jgi:hypothetical protein
MFRRDLSETQVLWQKKNMLTCGKNARNSVKLCNTHTRMAAYGSCPEQRTG